MRLRNVVRRALCGLAIAGLTISAAPSFAQLSPAQLKAQKDRTAREAALQAERQRAANRVATKRRNTTATKYTPPVWNQKLAYPKAWFLKQKDTEMWCGYRTFEEVQDAIDRGLSDGYTQASISFSGNKIEDIDIVWMSDSGDYIADDVYIFDSEKKVLRVWRTGRYIESPEASVSYVKDVSGGFRIDSASKIIIGRMRLAGYKTYVLTDTEYRPIYSSIEAMPFSDLISKNDDISTSAECLGSR